VGGSAPAAVAERARAGGARARRSGEILATARRHAATLDDAEDAYQRGLEVLLTKAPSTDEDELVPWLKTVVKHEAWALKRQRDRHTPTSDTGEPADPPTSAGSPHGEAERYERLRHGAEALGRLKPQEVRALRLKAQGFSYPEVKGLTEPRFRPGAGSGLLSAGWCSPESDASSVVWM
jgi:DNA-directed RNA polymerase specialized sigma24 family protein